MKTLPLQGWGDYSVGLSKQREVHLTGDPKEVPEDVPTVAGDLMDRQPEADNLVPVTIDELKIVLDGFNRSVGFLARVESGDHEFGWGSASLIELEHIATAEEHNRILTAELTEELQHVVAPWQHTLSGQEAFALDRQIRATCAQCILYILRHPADTTAKSVAREYAIKTALSGRQRLSAADETAESKPENVLELHAELRLPQQDPYDPAAAEASPHPSRKVFWRPDPDLSRLLSGQRFFYDALSSASHNTEAIALDVRDLRWHLRDLQDAIILANRIADLAINGDAYDNLDWANYVHPDDCNDAEFHARNALAYMILNLVNGESTAATRAIAYTIADAELRGHIYVGTSETTGLVIPDGAAAAEHRDYAQASTT